MPQEINKETWEPKAQELMRYMQSTLLLNATTHCGRVALRLDEYLTENRKLNLPPVSSHIADQLTQPRFKECQEGQVKKLKLVRSFTDPSTIIARCGALTQNNNQLLERTDLTNENPEVIEIDFAATIENDSENKGLKLHASNANDIIGALQFLPKRKQGNTAHGFIFYTLHNKNIVELPPLNRAI